MYADNVCVCVLVGCVRTREHKSNIAVAFDTYHFIQTKNQPKREGVSHAYDNSRCAVDLNKWPHHPNSIHSMKCERGKKRKKEKNDWN